MTSPYEYYGPILCIKAKWLYQVAKLVTKTNYDYHVRQGNFVLARKGGGRGRYALIEWDTLYPPVKEQVENLCPMPNDLTHNPLKDLITKDNAARDFFMNYTKNNGTKLSKSKQLEYINTAVILNACDLFQRKNFRKSQEWIWTTLVNYISMLDVNHRLNIKFWRTLKRTFKKYSNGSYEDLIHGGENNVNGKLIKDECADWLLAMYCLPNKIKLPSIMQKYNQIRKEKNFPKLTEQAVNHWLNEPAQKRIWTLMRQGEELYKNKFGYHVTRDKSDYYPNAYWAMDGTKFDVIHCYDNKQGMAAKLRIDCVIDIFSEKIIGYSISETESHVDHFTALKDAFKTSGCRPHLLTYDNQSGHKSAKMQELYDSLIAREGGVHYPHKAYRHSSPVEEIFGRLQQEKISPLWFSDKQSPTTRSDDSRPNMDFINANKHRLPSKDEAIKAFELVVKQWNEDKHPKYKNLTRNECYEMEMPDGKREEVDTLDMVHLFWVNETKEITYKPGGLLMRVGNHKYWFEVRDDKDKIDLEFRRKYVGAKFIVRYDPEFLDQYIQLYKITHEGLVFVTDATPKKTHSEVKSLTHKGAKEEWNEDFATVEAELERDYRFYEELAKRTGITAEKVIDEQELLIKTGGKLPKKQRNELESESSFDRIY